MPINTLEQTNRRFAVLDVDGTLVYDNAAYELVVAQEQEGLLNKPYEVLSAISKITPVLSGSGYRRAVQNFLEVHALNLRGQSESEVIDHAIGFYTKHKNDLILPFVEPTLEDLTARGYWPIIASANAHVGVEALARVLGISKSFSTEFRTERDQKTDKEIFTGSLGVVLDSAEKGGIAYALARIHGQSGQLALGNTPGDVGPLNVVEGGFCVMPNKELMRIARWCGWMVISKKQAKTSETPEPLLDWWKEREITRLEN